MNSFELDGILEKKDVIRYTLASVPILDLTIRHMSVVQEAGSDRKLSFSAEAAAVGPAAKALNEVELGSRLKFRGFLTCLLYTSDAADEEDSEDLGGRRISKKKK